MEDFGEKQKIQQAEAVELQGHLLADGVAFNEDGSVNVPEVLRPYMGGLEKIVPKK